MEIGEIYKPSIVNFADKDRYLMIDAIRCGRVEYTNLITNEYGEMSIEDFDWYYDKAEIQMNKPNHPKCETCLVINNILRCWNCKYKTKEWENKNKRPVMLIGEKDLYKPKTERED